MCIFMLMWCMGLCIDLPIVLAISVIGGGFMGAVPAGAPVTVSCARASPARPMVRADAIASVLIMGNVPVESLLHLSTICLNTT